MSNILISGGTGFIGKKVALHLQKSGYNIFILTRNRRAKAADGITPIYWDINALKIDLPTGLTIDTIIHLAGTNIGSGCWTKSRKEELASSRILSGQLLYNYFSNHPSLKTFISASAIGIYGHIPSTKVVSEEHVTGVGFIPELCKDWEKTASLFQQVGVRSVTLRIGIVLDSKQGALPAMIKPYKLGFGAILGDGKQLMSWIHIDDLIEIIGNSVTNINFNGTYNAVAPNPISNELFTRTLSEYLKKPLFPFAISPILLKLVLGEKSCLLLEGAGVIPARLQAEKFNFKYKTIYKALHNLIKMP